jgi:hypothetical protein
MAGFITNSSYAKWRDPLLPERVCRDIVTTKLRIMKTIKRIITIFSCDHNYDISIYV